VGRSELAPIRSPYGPLELTPSWRETFEIRLGKSFHHNANMTLTAR